MAISVNIRLEKAQDYRVTENLVREAFWNVYRPGALEHFVLHQFRQQPEFCSNLDFVMECDGEIIGQAMFVKNTLKTQSGDNFPILTLGPICIHPKLQRQGLGKQLLDYAVAQAEQTEAEGIFMEGNINFYGKCGFVVASTLGVHYMDEPSDDPVPYFLGKILKPKHFENLDTRYYIPQGYLVDEKQAEEFDKQFPYKEKLRLPGQLV